MDSIASGPGLMRRGDWRAFAAVFLSLAAVFAAIAVRYVGRFHLGFGEAIGIYTCFLTLLYLALLPGVSAGRAHLSRVAGLPRGLAFFFVFLIPYLVYALATSEFHWLALARIAMAVFVPPLVYLALPPRQPERFTAPDLLVGIFLIYVVLGGLLRGIWTVPVNLDFMGRLLLIGAVSVTWTAVRPVPHLNYSWRFSAATLRAAFLNFNWFALIAIPLGRAIRFTAWHPRWPGAAAFALDYLEIFLFIALLEELFFRGFLQSLLSACMKSELRAQFTVSFLFGLFHILHAPFPNWRYVALASIAGWFYGEAYRKGGGIVASACAHAAVDTIWRTFFTR